MPVRVDLIFHFNVSRVGKAAILQKSACSKVDVFSYNGSESSNACYVSCTGSVGILGSTVVAEDIDLATRAFLEESRFAYTTEVEVKNEVYSDWHRWFTQRRRWAIGQALWLKDWYKQLAGRFVKKPQVFLPSLFFLYPSVAVFFLSAVVLSMWMYNSFLVVSLFLSVKFNIALPIFLFSLATADLLKVLVISMSGFAITAGIFYGFGRKLGFNQIKLHELFIYYFFYSSVWFIIIIIGHIQVIALGKKAGPGWKT